VPPQPRAIAAMSSGMVFSQEHTSTLRALLVVSGAAIVVASRPCRLFFAGPSRI